MRVGTRPKAYDTASDPSRGRKRRTAVSWLGLLLLLFNLVAGGALPAQATTAAPDEFDHLVVCTAGGMAVVDRNGTPVTPDHVGENGFCGACLPFLHGAVLAPTVAATPRPIIQPLPRAPLAAAEPALVGRPVRLANPRAPPLV